MIMNWKRGKHINARDARDPRMPRKKRVISNSRLYLLALRPVSCILAAAIENNKPQMNMAAYFFFLLSAKRW